MAFNFNPIQKRNEWSVQMKAALYKVLKSMPGASGTPQVTPTSLTNSTAGTANDTVQATPQTVAAGTDTSAAQLVATNASLTIINNNFADLVVKVNQILTALKNAGLMS